jgi:cytidylate kinase
MVEPTIAETLAAAFAFVIFAVIIVLIVAGISLRVQRAMRREQKMNAEIDARILMAEHLHVHPDPTAPDAEYGAVNEARELLQRRR